VLAVGDAAFQKKCLGKMKDVSKSGRTIIFVSHQMAAIQNLCDKCLYLKKGKVVDYGLSEKIISQYLLSSQASNLLILSERTDRSGSGIIKFQSIKYKDENGSLITSAIAGSSLNIEFEIESLSSSVLSNLNVTVGIDDENAQRVTQLNNSNTNQIFNQVNPGLFKINIHIPVIPFKNGRYTISVFASVNGEIADWIQEATVLDIESGDFFKTGRLPEDGQGSTYVNHSYKILQ
jgi:lipopolysaccharide transport system ATP-binding protein